MASQWITSEEARQDNHIWRRRADAIITGVGTILADDPRMDVRHVATTIQPLRVVIDSKLRSSPRATVFREPDRALVYAVSQEHSRISVFQEHGISVKVVPEFQGRVDLAFVLKDLASRGANELHVEAGEALSGDFVRRDLVDEYLVYLAPKLVGQGRSMVEIGRLEDLQTAKCMQFHSVSTVGPDLRILARPKPLSSPS